MDKLHFDDQGLIPAIIQDFYTGEVLMMAYMNRESLKRTLEGGETCFWSRSRGKLWHKGESSGHLQKVRDIKYDCDGDTLLVRVEQIGVACHTGKKSCFFNSLYQGEEEEGEAGILDKLYAIISDRRANPQEGSYTNYLFNEGLDKILKKLAEEAGEVIIAAKNPDREELIYESGDLLYHLLVLLREKGVVPGEVFAELNRRFK